MLVCHFRVEIIKVDNFPNNMFQSRLRTFRYGHARMYMHMFCDTYVYFRTVYYAI